MYASYKNQVTYADLAAKNESILLSDILRLEREQQLMQGIQPIDLEILNPSVLRETALKLLKEITYQPKMVYNYLVNNNSVDDFIKYNYDFRKMIRKISNISYDEFVSQWSYFKNVEMKTVDFKNMTKYTAPEEREDIEIKEKAKKTLERMKLQREEENKRNNIKRDEDTILTNQLNRVENERKRIKNREDWLAVPENAQQAVIDAEKRGRISEESQEQTVRDAITKYEERQKKGIDKGSGLTNQSESSKKRKTVQFSKPKRCGYPTKTIQYDYR